MRTGSGREIVVLLEADKRLSDTDRELIELFTSRLSIAFDNVILYEQLQEANARLEDRVFQRTAELYRANQRLAAQRASLRRANEFKSEMLGTVAHDLKNPLGIILGRAEIMTDLLASEPLPLEPMGAQVDHIRDSARRLTAMVDDLIIEAMNDALDISIRREPIDFAALVADVVASNRPLAERKEQKIVLSGLGSLRLERGPGAPARGDRQPPRQRHQVQPDERAHRRDGAPRSRRGGLRDPRSRARTFARGHRRGCSDGSSACRRNRPRGKAPRASGCRSSSVSRNCTAAA